MRKAVESIKLDLRTVAIAAPVQQAVRDSAAISWSQLRDLNSRPTVYERVEVSGHAGAKQGQVAPPEEDRENSGCPVVAADVTRVGEASNGLAATSDAAFAAWVLALLDAGDVAGARALLEEILESS
ncbi:MAG: hypothetical protein AMXMBFR56_63910 [Polyangiaceae bacterium]